MMRRCAGRLLLVMAFLLVAGCATEQVADRFALGADVSWLELQEKAGLRFADANGNQVDALLALRDLGVNAIRIRVWVNPAGGINDSAYVLRLARRASALWLRLMIDFHYSDSWADPGQQATPAAWAAMRREELEVAVRAHTRGVLSSLKAEGIAVEWVQVGNEINSGLMWPTGRTPDFARIAALINAGNDAAKSVYPDAQVVLHLANGHDNAVFRWFFDGVRTAGAHWDVIGMSHYPAAADWPAKNAALEANMRDMIARYGRPLLVAEVGMDWRDGTAARAMLADVMRRLRALPDADRNGLGIFYWEPQAHPGWQGYTMGAMLPSGQFSHALDAIRISPGR